ncbi:uncharacterized protein FTJAE_10788 [Fusarium tjaetaba]|uniref:Uncharacterized protein n=1 Tax=Fusarium tjaetaba TaxID=1567544 RepID=A0A8H5QX57_9HYPO|nr:uncharacterized protein FTJAE_10788 [Fusarium tjaetaba]KAF5622809.1 hypothetical protein FTJAE_10788 [Fusarium tjaetaba]
MPAKGSRKRTAPEPPTEPPAKRDQGRPHKDSLPIDALVSGSHTSASRRTDIQMDKRSQVLHDIVEWIRDDSSPIGFAHVQGQYARNKMFRVPSELAKLMEEDELETQVVVVVPNFKFDAVSRQFVFGQFKTPVGILRYRDMITLLASAPEVED